MMNDDLKTIGLKIENISQSIDALIRDQKEETSVCEEAYKEELDRLYDISGSMYLNLIGGQMDCISTSYDTADGFDVFISIRRKDNNVPNAPSQT